VTEGLVKGDFNTATGGGNGGVYLSHNQDFAIAPNGSRYYPSGGYSDWEAFFDGPDVPGGPYTGRKTSIPWAEWAYVGNGDRAIRITQTGLYAILTAVNIKDGSNVSAVRVGTYSVYTGPASAAPMYAAALGTGGTVPGFDIIPVGSTYPASGLQQYGGASYSRRDMELLRAGAVLVPGRINNYSPTTVTLTRHALAVSQLARYVVD
jgi:hypothetical protein